MRKELLFLLSFMAITAAAQPKKLLGGDVTQKGRFLWCTAGAYAGDAGVKKHLGKS